MKLAARRIDGFLAHPDDHVCAVLIYGPDDGLVQERVRALTAAVAGDARDPFRTAEISAAVVRSDPAALVDEAAALSFSGGRRVVRVRECGDVLTDAFRQLLDGKDGGALVVAEAGDLAPRSSLRKLFEGVDNAAAVPCYVDDEHGLSQVIGDGLAAHRLKATDDAMQYLIAHLGANRSVTRAEIEKLALYKGDDGTVTIDDAAACIDDSGAASLDAAVFAACGGDMETLDRALVRTRAEGTSSVALLRAVARHLQRLHLARGLVTSGKTPDQAMTALRPAVFFKQRDAFRDQLRRWSEAHIATGLDIVTQAELDCKSTGMPDEALCGRALMRLAQAARQFGGDRRKSG